MADGLRFDPTNANKGTVRGRGMLERSLSHYGAGRAPVASADGVILAGNKTVEVARELGIPIREVESDGRTLFVIRRTDLPYDDPRARELAIADNRVGEVSLDWAPEVLAALADDGADLGQFWYEPELDRLLSSGEDVPDFDPAAEWQGMPEYEQDDREAVKRVIVNFETENDVRQFARLVEQNVSMTTKSIWYPAAAKQNRLAERYEGVAG